MGDWTRERGAAVVAAVIAVAVSAAAGADPPARKPAPLHFLPKARQMSTYVFEGRFEIAVREVSFEIPEAYQDGFKFWAGRMKGQQKSETCEMMTMTQDAADGGQVPFRRTIPKFDVEIRQQGQIMTPGPTVERSVASLVWEGTLDRLGNVQEMRQTAGNHNPEIDGLAIPEMSRIFPEVEGPRDFEIGQGFTEERVVRLPTKLNIAGLERITLKYTREYKLKSVDGDLATFEVKITYSNDPDFKPDAEKTSCQISGGGSGEADFEIKRGVFLQSRLPASMRIDIEAPLRPLPNQPSTNAPSLGKSHIDLDLLLSGRQTVRRVWGEEQD